MDSRSISRYNHDVVIVPEDMNGLADLHSSPTPDSPPSIQIDYNARSAMNYFQEQHSSTEAPPSRRSSSYSSSIDSRSSLNFLSSNFHDNMNALQNIETLLMAPDADDAAKGTGAGLHHNHSVKQEPPFDGSCQNGSRKYQKLSHGPDPDKIPRGNEEARQLDIRWLLVECAKAISENRLNDFEILVEETNKVVSIVGDPIQRVGAYMLEGLRAKNEASGTRIYQSLRCEQPPSSELLSYMQILYNMCPYLKFGYMAANGAIAEAVKNEDRIHIVDFQIAQGGQWLTLIQALAKRPGGPPRLRITGIDDDVSRYARGDGLHIVGQRLASLSRKLNVPFEFQTVPVYGPETTREMLNVRPGEALVVNFTLQLHHTPDESVDVRNPRDELLRMVKGLSPKVMTLVEQESNTNTAPFLTRFVEILDYYLAMFESIDEALPRDDRKRINTEQHCLAKDIVNVIACEGKERIERHEVLGKWRYRLITAGFRQCPLSPYVNSVIRSLLGCYSQNYTLVEKDGAMLLGWKNRNLISASAWH